MLLFLATLVSVYLVYGFQWMEGSPLADRATAWGAARFALALMAILLAHEMGHYLVARHHGFRLSLPYFIPFPAAFGTFGAIIRLKSLPRSRTALLEMGAAGPLAGLVVAIIVMAIGLPGTIERVAPEVVMAWPPPPVVLPDPGWLDEVLSGPPLARILPTFEPGSIPLTILANPPVMDLLGMLLLGAPPGRYAELDPLAMAGWVGCLLTAINLVPIGQLDGGHVFNALFPGKARLMARIGLAVALVGGVFWLGWAFWAVLLLVLRAWMSLPVPEDPQPSRRARLVAIAAVVAFAATFMPRPVEMESLALDELVIKTPDGAVVPADQVRAWRDSLRDASTAAP